MDSDTARFQAALDAFVERASRDQQVLAIVLFGSLSYDVVWHRSDIDLMLVIADLPAGAKHATRDGVALVEDDVYIHASLMPRSEFKRQIDSALRSSFLHSMFSRSRLVFTRDDTLQALYDDAQRLGARDRQTQLLNAGSFAVLPLAKAEKFLRIKHDPLTAYLWLTHAYTPLAQIEVYLAGGIAGREVLDQARALNPAFFDAIYTDMLSGGITAERVENALQLIDDYLTEHLHDLYQPLLDYLAEAGTIRSATEIGTWARRELGIEGAVSACEWLADKEIVTLAAAPTRLTPKSLADVQELAFLYLGDA
ncbi:MAG: hypothetical protein HYU66_07385 [Armatimonadetes bacterium]|nr:hypothetical protein [Armatimonadota bacterium]